MIRKIGYVSRYNPFVDRTDWSGTRYKIREAIEKAGYEVKWVQYRVPKRKEKMLKFFLKIINGKRFDYKRHPLYYRLCAHTMDVKKANECDALFFPGCAQIMLYIKYKKPVLYYIDATFNNLSGFYFSCSSQTQKYGNLTESLAIDRCDIILHSSYWSRRSAISFYKSNPEKNYVLEFGANIDDSDIVIAEQYDGDVLNVLFSGVNWERKGAQCAIDTVQELNNRGIKSRLFLCGIKCIPEDSLPLPDFVINYGFLNKNIPDQYEKYISILKKSHIFLLPTKAECSAIVFCEASAFGIPILTYLTGGLDNYVVDGINGYKLPLGASCKEFADVIQRCLINGDLNRLSNGGRSLFAEKLSWNAWSQRFRDLMQVTF